MKIDMWAIQDGKQAIRNIVAKIKDKYDLPNCIISGILAEILAEVRDMELSEIMLALEADRQEQASDTKDNIKN